MLFLDQEWDVFRSGIVLKLCLSVTLFSRFCGENRLFLQIPRQWIEKTELFAQGTENCQSLKC